MEDSGRFSERILKYIGDVDVNGKSMVNMSRSILSIDYSDKEYAEEFFNIFNIIIDDYSDGYSYDDIEASYKFSFVESILKFRNYFSL